MVEEPVRIKGFEPQIEGIPPDAPALRRSWGRPESRRLKQTKAAELLNKLFKSCQWQCSAELLLNLCLNGFERTDSRKPFKHEAFDRLETKEPSANRILHHQGRRFRAPLPAYDQIIAQAGV